MHKVWAITCWSVKGANCPGMYKIGGNQESVPGFARLGAIPNKMFREMQGRGKCLNSTQLSRDLRIGVEKRRLSIPEC